MVRELSVPWPSERNGIMAEVDIPNADKADEQMHKRALLIKERTIPVVDDPRHDD